MRGLQSSLRQAPAATGASNRTSVDQSTRRPIRVFVVADVHVQRELLADQLANEDGIELAGSSAGDVAGMAIGMSEPAVVLVEASADFKRSRAATLIGIVPAAKIVAVGIPEDEALLIELLEAGIAGYVTAEQPLEELVAVIKAAATGELRCSSRVSAALAERMVELKAVAAEPAPEHRLTRRQRDIAALIADGLSNKQIAARLALQQATVKNHVHNILATLGVSCRDEVARLMQTSS